MKKTEKNISSIYLHRKFLDKLHIETLKLVNEEDISILTRLPNEIYKNCRVTYSICWDQSLFLSQKITVQTNANISGW